MFNKLFQMLVSELGVLMHASLHELGAKFVFNVHQDNKAIFFSITQKKKRAPFQLFVTLVACSVKKNN